MLNISKNICFLLQSYEGKLKAHIFKHSKYANQSAVSSKSDTSVGADANPSPSQVGAQSSNLAGLNNALLEALTAQQQSNKTTAGNTSSLLALVRSEFY